MITRRPSSLLASFAALVLAASPAFAQHPVAVRHVPTMVTEGRARHLGAYPKSEKLHLTLNLALRNEEELNSLIASLYDRSSPQYHQYLTPGEFDARFGPTQRSFDSVLRWAESQGFKVTYKTANNRLVEVDATVADANRAFNVTVSSYHDPRLNRDFHAPDREPTVDLDVPLASIEGLDNAEPIRHHLVAGPHATITSPDGVTRPANPMSGVGTSSNVILGGASSNAVIGGTGTLESSADAPPTPHISGSGPGNTYLPSDMRAAYYGSGPLDGTGQSVGIFSFDGYLTSDLTLYYSSTGTTQTVPVTNRLVGTYAGNCYSSSNGTSGTCDDGEQILDIVNVIGVAPKLDHIYFYEYTSASAELSLMASDNLAKIISSSWGGGGFGTASDTYFQQMATQGQTFLNATGDDGALNSGTYAAPSLDPYVIQVGGTDLVTAGAGGPWVSETAWAPSGGGYWITGISTSAKYLIPNWQSQAGVITATNKGSTVYRNVPDMAAEADFDNTTASNGSFLSGYGGTSYATPRMAGYMALANQKSVAAGGATLGFFNPTLYTAGLSTSSGHYLHDITSGSNPNLAGSTAVSYNSVAGYDLVTGWGSPNGDALLNYLDAIPDFGMTVGSSTMTITRGATGNTGTQTITIGGYSGFAGTVGVSASGLPTGVTYSATSGDTTTPATITFTANATTAIQGTYTVTLTGTSGANSHSTTFTLNILKRTNGDFTLSATSPSILQGNSATSTITVSEGAIAGPIALAFSGLPSGVTAALTHGYVDSPGSLTTTSSGTDTLTLNVALSALAGTYPITVTGTSGGNIVHSTTFTLTVTAPPSYVLNGGFETVSGTTAANWTLTSGVLSSGSNAHSGTYYAYLDGYGSAHTDTATQTGIVIPAGKTSATLTFFLYIGTAETTTTAKNDTFTVNITPTSPAGSTTAVATFSNLDHAAGYVFHTVDVSAYIGQTITLNFTGVENSSLQTTFLLDDIALITN